MQARAEWRTAGDWLPVLFVAAAAQSGIGLEQPWAGSDLELAVVALALALPLALRRRFPLVAAGLVGLTLALQVVLGGSLHFGSFLAVLVAAYAGGRHADRWTTSVTVGAVLVGGAVGSSFRGADDLAFVVFPVFYITAAVAVGRVVRRLTHQAADLRRLNAALARERDASARLAVATERVRLARDLHDVVAHTLTVMVVQAEAAEDSLGRDPVAAGRALRSVQDAGRRGLSDLRSMVRVLRSDDVAPDPDLDELDTLATVLGEAGLEVTLDLPGPDDAVDPAVGVELFRVVQEALTNVVKHSAAGSARVRLTTGTDGLLLEVTDPGPALAPGAAPSGGHGIAGMAERVSGLGGDVDAGPLPAGGFRVLVRVPSPLRVTEAVR